PNVVQTVLAGLTATAAAFTPTPSPTGTLVPTTTGTPQPTSTPTATATFPVGCILPTNSTTVTPASGGAVSAGNGLACVTASFPRGAVNGPVLVTLTLSGTTGTTAGLGTSARGVGPTFTVEARDALANPVTAFSQPFTLTFVYADADVAGTDVTSLRLFRFD